MTIALRSLRCRLALLILTIAVPAWAQYPLEPRSPLLDPDEEQPVPPVTAELIADYASVQPGRTIHLGVRLTIQHGWAVYWRNPGDLGTAPTVDIEMPTGFKASAVCWPGPTRVVHASGMIDYVYRNEVILIVPVSVPKTLDGVKEVTFKAQCDWVASKDASVIGHASLDLTLPTARDKSRPQRSGDFAAIERAMKQVPIDADDSDVDVHQRWKHRTLYVSVPDADALTFYPDRSREWSLTDLAETGHVKGTQLGLSVLYRTVRTRAPVTGVLGIKQGKQVLYITIQAEPPS
ncbi:MAG: hypothetical protein KAS72_07225 [Phycisphaerales bacterium]|nr:hypothetical protein [Phycisphaerales bacterium]